METKKQNPFLKWAGETGLEIASVLGPLALAWCFTGLLAYLSWRVIAWLEVLLRRP